MTTMPPTAPPQPNSESGATVAKVAAGLGRESATPELLETIGWVAPEQRSGTSVLIDHEFGACASTDPRLVVMPLAQALVEFPWVQDLVFSQISPQEDEVLHRAFESTREPLGTFTWVKDGATISLPNQSFTVLTKPQERQFVHDITVIGDDVTIDSVSGAAVAPALTNATHVSVSETFIGNNSTVRSISVDRWGKNMQVHTYERTTIGRNSKLSSISVAVSGLRHQQDDSVTIVGENSTCIEHSIVFAPAGTHRDVRNRTVLGGRGAQAEQVARMVSDGGEIRNSSTLVAETEAVRGFLECDGLMLKPQGRIESVPALDAQVDQAQLSHEASVGMIDDAKLDYLRAFGLGEDNARDPIVQGFLNLEDQRIPESVRATVENLVTAARGAEKM